MDFRSCSKPKLVLILLLSCGAIWIHAANVSSPSTNEDQSKKPGVTLPTCPEPLSCKGRCSTVEEKENATKPAPHCHCDPQCEQYRDCCVDHRKFCVDTKNISAPSLPVRSKTMACVKTNTEKKISVWMVIACAKNWSNDDMKRRCLAGSRPNRTFTSQTIAEDVPVMDMWSGVHYRNKYCALCNGVDYFLLHYWYLRIRCNIKPPDEYGMTEKIDFLLKYCPTRYTTIDKGLLRRFCYDTVTTCPGGETSVHRTRCEQGPTHVVSYMQDKKPKMNYKNLDCLSCNGLPTKNAACGPRDTHGNIFNPKSFEVVMKISEDLTAEFHPTCSRNFVYDNHLQICRSKSHKIDPSKAVSDKYRFKVWLSPLDGAHPDNFTKREFVDALIRAVDITPSQVTVLNLGSEDMSVAVTFDAHAQSFNATVTQSNEDYTNTSALNRIGVQELLKPNASFLLTINRIKWSVLKITWRQLACVKMDTYLPGEFMLFPNNNSMLINKTGEVLPVTAYYLKDDLRGVKVQDKRTAYVCRSAFTVFCPHHFVPIKREDYAILANGNLNHTRTGTQFSSGEYYIDNGFGVVCTNDTERFTSKIQAKTRALPENVVRRYMTIVGMSVSVLSLLIVLFTHFMFPDLRSPLPGKNLMNLSLSLLLAHFMFLLGSGDTDQPTFCRVTAMVLHWLFLVSFTCMAIIAHDTRATFSRKMSKVQGGSIGQSHIPRFLMYTAVAWGVPLLLVAVCALLDWLSVFDIGYGGHRACWIAGDGTESQRNAQLIVFAAPVGCILVYNVFAFSQTIWAISVARQQTHRLNKTGHNNPNMVKIYIRLLSLMGFSWFFGFSAAYIHEALMYPFVFFSTLQGLYLFLAFVCKARVWRMCRDKFSRNPQTMRRPTAYTATTTTECRGLKPTKLVEESIAETNM